MMDLKKKLTNLVVSKRTVFYVIGGLVVFLEIWFLVTTVPRQIEEIQTLQNSQTQIFAEVEKLDKAVKILAGVDQPKLATELASVNAVLPSLKKTSGLVAGISKIATDSSVTVKEINFTPGRISTDSAQTQDEIITGSFARRVGASLSIFTNLDNLTLFLGRIQAASQLIGVDAVSFSGQSGRQQTADITLSVYYEPMANASIDWEQVRPLTDKEVGILQTLKGTDVFILPGEGR